MLNDTKLQQTIHCVVGGQYGSEAKGHVAAYLGREVYNPIGVRVGGPNAGHSVVDRHTDRTFALRCVPVQAVVDPVSPLVIAAGSEIDPEVLAQEVETLEAAGIQVQHRLWIDEMATILGEEHKLAERDMDLTGKLGSTSKGIGAARADRILRRAAVVRDSKIDFPGRVTDTLGIIEDWLANRGNVIIEGTQGYGLGLHHPNYPFATSGNCRAIDLLAQVGLSPWSDRVRSVETWVVFRTYPIRVAGNSGPMANETTWEQLELLPEFTTVTKKRRRVAGWDPLLALQAMHGNGAPSPHVHAVVTFLDYILRDKANQKVAWQELVDRRDEKGHLDVSFGGIVEDLGMFPRLVSTGPDTMTEFPAWVERFRR
jgi:adenylosuccinate synthase